LVHTHHLPSGFKKAVGDVLLMRRRYATTSFCANAPLVYGSQ
jgi:hypothetical protein